MNDIAKILSESAIKLIEEKDYMKALETLVQNPEEQVGYKQQDTFIVNNIALLRRSADGNRQIAEITLSRECDVIRNIRSNDLGVELFLKIGGKPYVLENAIIPMMCLQYNEVKIYAYLPFNLKEFTIHKECILLQSELRKSLMNNILKTPTFSCANGMTT